MDAIVEEEPDPAAEEDSEAEDPGLVARGLGCVVAACGAAIFVLYVAVPVGDVDGTDVPALIDLNSTYQDIGTILQCLMVVVAGLVAVVRPARSAGLGVLAAAALPLPWLLNLCGSVRDVPESALVLQAVEVLGVVLAVAVAVALVVTLTRRRGPDTGVLLTDMVALMVGLTGLWGTLSIGWYRIAELQQPTRFGGLLSTDTWAGRGAWAGLVLAVAALVLAVMDLGVGRRAVGAALSIVLVAEALRRTLLSSDAILGDAANTQFGPIEANPVVGYIAFQLLGAAAGAWLATTSGEVEPEGAVAAEGDQVDPGPPPSDAGGPWPPPPGESEPWPGPAELGDHPHAP